MKKILVLLLALSMLAALLPAAAVAAEPTDLTFWTYVELHSEFFEDAARFLIFRKVFCARHYAAITPRRS